MNLQRGCLPGCRRSGFLLIVVLAVVVIIQAKMYGIPCSFLGNLKSVSLVRQSRDISVSRRGTNVMTEAFQRKSTATSSLRPSRVPTTIKTAPLTPKNPITVAATTFKATPRAAISQLLTVAATRRSLPKTHVAPRNEPGRSDQARHRGLFDYEARNGSLASRAYWMSNTTIVAILLRPLKSKAPSQCTYGGVKASKLEYLTDLGEIHEGKVAPTAVICTFTPGVIEPHTTSMLHLAGLSTHLHESESVTVYNFRPSIGAQRPFAWSVCVPALHTEPNYEWLGQWLAYYSRRLRADHVFMYSVMPGQRLQDLERLGVPHVDLQNVSLLNLATQMQYSPCYFGQTFAIHDCLWMNRHLRTEWVMFQDFDEVLTIPSEFPLPIKFFRSFSASSATALTFGSWNVDIGSCLDKSLVGEENKDWPLLAQMRCVAEPTGGYTQADWQGRRKYVLRPERHVRLYVHKPQDGVVHNLAAQHTHVRHYGGLMAPWRNAYLCKKAFGTRAHAANATATTTVLSSTAGAMRCTLNRTIVQQKH
eukprot:scpid56423/ scgid14686/ 